LIPAEHAAEASQSAPTAASGQSGDGGAGLPLKIGRAIQHARTDGNATPGQPLADIAQAAVAAAHADADEAPAANDAPVTQAIKNTVAVPTASPAADVTTGVENAASAVVEAVASAEASADNTGTRDSSAQEQASPKPQTQSASTTAPATVAAAGPSDGVRFSVAGAAGNAAYTSAAPRNEEAVLPQIVHSIRLHAVQGTTEARVQLKPEHLGALNITLKVEQNQVTATIQAEVGAVRQWIESHESSLRQALSEQGLHLAKLVVNPDDQQARDDHKEDRPRRQPRRRSWRDQEATFEVLV
jgi:flagellar hook-length control protein FliK